MTMIFGTDHFRQELNAEMGYSDMHSTPSLTFVQATLSIVKKERENEREREAKYLPQRPEGWKPGREMGTSVKGMMHW